MGSIPKGCNVYIQYSTHDRCYAVGKDRIYALYYNVYIKCWNIMVNIL